MMTNNSKIKRSRKTSSNNNKIVFCYRKSTDSEDLQKNSIQMQRDAARDFAKQHNLNIVAEYEESQSGTVPLSQAYGVLQALEACETFGAAYLGFDQQDRAARSLSRWYQLKAMTAEMGVQIVLVKNGTMPSDEAGDDVAELRELLNGFMSQQTVKVMRRRISDALTMKKTAQNRWTNKAPIGFAWSDDGKLVANESERQMVFKIREFGTKGMGYSEISRELTGMGYRSRNGQAIAANTVWRILNGKMSVEF